MKTHKNRRTFISTSLKATVGLYFTGVVVSCSGEKKPNPKDFVMISFCCRNCEECDALKNKQCGGCKSNLNPELVQCSIKKCAIKKEVVTCAHCNDFDSCTVEKWKDPEYLKTRDEYIKSLKKA